MDDYGVDGAAAGGGPTLEKRRGWAVAPACAGAVHAGASLGQARELLPSHQGRGPSDQGPRMKKDGRGHGTSLPNARGDVTSRGSALAKDSDAIFKYDVEQDSNLSNDVQEEGRRKLFMSS